MAFFPWVEVYSVFFFASFHYLDQIKIEMLILFFEHYMWNISARLELAKLNFEFTATVSFTEGLESNCYS